MVTLVGAIETTTVHHRTNLINTVIFIFRSNEQLHVTTNLQKIKKKLCWDLLRQCLNQEKI